MQRKRATKIIGNRFFNTSKYSSFQNSPNGLPLYSSLSTPLSISSLTVAEASLKLYECHSTEQSLIKIKNKPIQPRASIISAIVKDHIISNATLVSITSKRKKYCVSIIPVLMLYL